MNFASRLFAASALLALATAAPVLALDKVSYGTNWLAEGEHGGFYFPIVTCIVISVVLSLVLWIGGKF